MTMQVESTAMLPEWIPAYDAVWSLLPVTREHITEARSCITPSAILHYAELSEVAIKSGVVAQWEEHDCGPGLYTKMELFDRVFSGVSIPQGAVILITDDCFPITAREPILCRGESLRDFVASSPLFVFDGDAVFIWPEARHIVVFHHEGTFAHIDFHVDPA